ncbi:MAG: ATP-binding protein [Bacteroidota bacterium]
MNHLRKIIFINSASVRYQEMDLNGNIHVIGKNGTGKSSILRAILFFYSANTQRLGIKANQSSFTDFYFPHPNSWLVYEIKGTLGLFTIAAFRKSNRISFRFINGAYEREMFLDDDGMAHTIQELITQVNTRGLHHSRSIDKYEDYRSIIYGTLTGSHKTDYRKYALFEAKSHDNVWRTISNIFLNARLESQFIKKTLIESITDRSFIIDLKIIQKELEDFSHNRQDIDLYRRFKSRPGRILQQADHIKELEQQQILLAQDLAKSLNAGKTALQQINDLLESQQGNLKQEEEATRKLHAEEQARLHDLNKRLGVIEHDLTTATKKQTYYEEIGISAILASLAKKPSLERELDNRKADYQTLTSEFANIEQEFTVRIQALENEQTRLDLDLAQQKNRLEQEGMKSRTQVLEETAQRRQHIREQSARQQSQIQAELEAATQAFHELRIQEVQIRSTSFYEEDMHLLKQELAEAETFPNQLHAQIALAKEQLKHLDLQESHELKQLESDKQLTQKKLQDKIAICEDRITTIQSQIEQSQSAFMGWLAGRYPDWEKNIGKVCRDEVLFHPYLSPSIERLNDLLFGVQIDLEELEVEVPSLESLQQESQTLEEQTDRLKKEWLTFVKEWEKKKINCEKRYRQKRKKINKTIQQHDNQLEQYTLQQKKLRVHIDQLQLKAQQLKEQKVLALQYKIQAQKDLITEATNSLQQQQEEEEGLSQQIQQQQQVRILEIDQQVQLEIQKIVEQEKRSLKEFEGRKNILLKEKNQALVGKGIDVQQLESLQNAILELQSLLESLHPHQETVVLYHRDKTDYLDRMDSFRSAIQQLESQISEVGAAFARKRKQQEHLLNDIRQQISDTSQEITKWQAEFEAYDLFCKSPLYEKISSILSSTLESQSVDSLPILIQQLNATDQEFTGTWDTLRRQITAFLGHFRIGNVFNFPDNLPDEQAYRTFATTLREFVETQKIEDFEREISKQYAQLVGKISEEVRALSSLEEEIYKIISRINKSFRESNFVGVVKEIQLKMEDSTNPVVRALKHLKEYDDQYGMQLGGPSLFSQTDNTETNRKAIALLEVLTESLKGYKEDQLQLEDTFQLAFRVQENQNDTGWVERLSSVGSNGTDVLVKAMIYITLLSVFKDRSSKKKQEFRLHCIIDEVGILDTSYLQDLITFANAKNITLINGSPNENNPLAYNHIYHVRRDEQDFVRVNRLISQVGSVDI